MMKSLSMKDWIAKDTMYPMKTQMAIRLVVSSDDLAIPETKEKFTMTEDDEVELLFYDYNKSVSIELPEAAEGAVGLPLIPVRNQTTQNQTATTSV